MHVMYVLLVLNTALESCLGNCRKEGTEHSNASQHSSSSTRSEYHSPMSGFTQTEDDLPTHRELRLVAMHMPDWEKLGERLNIDSKLLNQYRQSHRYMHILHDVIPDGLGSIYCMSCNKIHFLCDCIQAINHTDHSLVYEC